MSVSSFLKNEQGISLLITIIMIFVVATACLAFIAAVHRHGQITYGQIDEVRATMMAENGLSEALWRIDQGEIIATENTEHFCIFQNDTLGSYKYVIATGAQDTLIATGFFPDENSARIVKTIKLIL